MAVLAALALPPASGSSGIVVASESGRFRLQLWPSVDPAPLQQFHEWRILVERTDGQPTDIGALFFDGGMPSHGHGLPSQPVVTASGPGRFRVSGVRFSMAGQWELRIAFRDAGGWDRAVVPLRIGMGAAAASSEWTDGDIAVLRSLWIGSIGRVRPDPTNRVADDPRAAALGRKLFFDKSLSANGSVACASCHDPAKQFTDGLRVSKGISDMARNSPSLVGVSENRWFDWDGRRDSLWSQALDPMEAGVEMGTTRVSVLRRLGASDSSRQEYEALFGQLPDLRGLPEQAGPAGDDHARAAWDTIPEDRQAAINRAFANVGKAIAAFERTIRPAPTRFDKYVGDLVERRAGEATLTSEELAGLRIFLGPEARCVTCHNGPMFTDGGFHNVGTGVFDGDQPDFGRSVGVASLEFSTFNCASTYSDNNDCPELKFLKRDDHGGSMQGAFKVPTLRGVAETGPYMHDGRFATLEEVLEHYRNPPAGGLGGELRPLQSWTDESVREVAAFLRTLSPVSRTDDKRPK